MLNDYPVLQDLPPETRAEIERIIKIPSGQRTTGEAAFLNARSAYLGFDSSNNVIKKSGTEVPAPGSTGYGQGGIFQKVDFFGRVQEIYQNVGTETNANFAFIGRNSGYKVTVSANATGDYNIPPGTTDSQITINKAVTFINGLVVNGLGGGTVEVQSGEYIISDVIKVKSNCDLIGVGIDRVKIKAKDNYDPSTPAPTGQSGSRIMLIAATSGLKNCTISGITWDLNVQNNTGLSNNTRHRVVWIQGSSTDRADNIRFENNKVINSINWAVFFQYVDRLWIDKNIVYGGYSAEYSFNDGIHCRNVRKVYITRNYVDTTYGSSVSGGGDDAIVVLSEAGTSADSTEIHIDGNICASAASGIHIGVDGTKSLINVSVTKNIIWLSDNSGIAIEKYEQNSLGRNVNLLIDGNIIYDYAHSGGGGGINIKDQVNTTIDETGFDNVIISRNIIHTNTSTDNVDALRLDTKGNKLTVTNNQVINFTGVYPVRIGGVKHPIKDLTFIGNTIEFTGPTPTECQIYGVERGIIALNIIKGTQEGTTTGFKIYGGGSADSDNQSVSNAELSKYLLVTLNEIYNTDVGIEEANSGSAPSNNEYINNKFIGVTTPYGSTLLANTNATIVGSDGAGNYGIGTGTPDTKFHLYGVDSGNNIIMQKLQNSATASNTAASIDWNLSTTNMGSNPSVRVRGIRTGSPGADLSIHTLAGAGNLVERFRATSNGNVILGNQSAVATNATDGFAYIPTCAGTPTGTPTAYTGKVPMIFDTTNLKLYVYTGGAWKSTSAFT